MRNIVIIRVHATSLLCRSVGPSLRLSVDESASCYFNVGQNSINYLVRNRPSWRAERALNSETFGAPSVAAARRFHHGRHGRGGWRGGGGGGFRRGGGQQGKSFWSNGTLLTRRNMLLQSRQMTLLRVLLMSFKNYTLYVVATYQGRKISHFILTLRYSVCPLRQARYTIFATNVSWTLQKDTL